MRLRRLSAAAAATAALAGLLSAAPAGATSSGHSSTATAARVLGPIRVAGNRLVDGRGHLLTLRGIQRDGPQEAAYGTSHVGVSKAEIDAMHRWGANVVRIPLDDAKWARRCPGQYDKHYESYIDAIVHWVNADGMVALLDLHVTSGSRCGPLGRHAAPDGDAVAFWKQAAAHYANWPLVMFELFNEPHVWDMRTWLDGRRRPIADRVQTGPHKTRTTVYIPVGEQQLYDAVEGTGAHNVVVIDADGYGMDPSAIKNGYAVNDYRHNIVYAVHPYTCSALDLRCTEDAHSQQANVAVLASFLPVAVRYPVFATEFGWPDLTDGSSFYRSTYRWLDAQSPAWSSVAFAWDGTTNGGFTLLASTQPSFRPNASGRAVLAELRARH